MHRSPSRLRTRSLTFSLMLLMLAGLLPGSAGAAAPSAAPTITGPSSGALVGANPTLAWQALSGAAKYRVQVSTSAAFGTTVVSVDTINIRYIAPVDLPLGTLYWRVAGMDASNALGPWADSTFEKAWASAPTLTTPADVATLSFPGNPPVFVWSPLTGAKMYTLEIDDDPAFLSPTAYATPNTSYALTVPQTIGQPWYWRVRGTSATTGVVSPWSAVRSYTLTWASAPTLVSPLNTTLTPIEDVNFRWQPVLGAATYDLQVSPNGDWANNLILNQTGIKGTRFSPAATLDNAPYFWRVRARDAAGNIGAWSAEWQFARGWKVLPTQTYPSWDPLDPLVIPNVTVPTFVWTPVQHASHYEIQVSTDVNFSPATIKNCYTNRTTWTPYSGGSGAPGGCGVSLGIGTVYYWRVRGIDAPTGVLGLWSSLGPDDTFRFIWRPDIPTLLDAGEGDPNVATPVLSWEPSVDTAQYKVTILKANDAVAVSVNTYGLTYTPTAALTPADGPFSWYVQTVDGNGVVGLIPSSLDWHTFSLASSTTSTPLTITAPANASSHVRMPSMQWNAYTGASYYKVRYGVAGSGIVNGTPLSGSAKLPYPAFTYASVPLSAGTYFWYVEAYDADNIMIAVSVDSTFVIAPPLTVGSGSYTEPCDATGPCRANVKDTPTLEWESTPLAGAYLVYLAMDPEFTNIYRTYETAQTRLSPRESFLDSQAGQAYHWFVRPCIDWAATRCGPGPDTTANANAGAFEKKSAPTVLSSPASNAVVSDLVTFGWQDYLVTNGGLAPPVTQEARQYRIQVSTVTDFSSILDDATVDQTTYTPWTKTYPEGPLYWRVQAIDGSGNAQTFSIQRKVTKASPAVALALPANGANVSGAPTLKWTAQAYAARYTIEIYRNGDLLFSPANLVASQVTPMVAWTPTTSLPAGDYAWRVRRLDAGNLAGPWSSGRTFTLKLAAPALTAPADGAVYRHDLLLFSWTAVSRAVQYKWELSASSSFAVIAASQATVRTSWAPTVKYADGTWYWRVKVLDAAGNTLATSSYRTFVKDTVKPTVTANAPTSAASISGPFSVTFKEPVTGVSTTTFTMVIAGTATAIAGTVTPSSSTSTTTASFTPTNPLVPGQSYAVSLTSGIKDAVGNTLVPFTWTVRTALAVENTSPALLQAWDRDSSASASGSAYAAARTAGMKLTFTFTGTNVTVVGRRAPDGGKADVYLDGVKQATFDSYNAAVQWQTSAWTKSGLANKQHKVEVRALGTRQAASSNSWVYVDAFKSSTVVTQETGAAVRASFARVNDASASGGSYDRVLHDTAGDTGGRPTFTMTFVGTGLSLYSTKTTDGGAVDIYVDNVLYGNDVSLYGAAKAYKQKVFTSPALVSGTHTIRIEATGIKPAGSSGTWVNVDYLLIK